MGNEVNMLPSGLTPRILQDLMIPNLHKGTFFPINEIIYLPM